MALTPVFRAACPATPFTAQSSTISPFSATTISSEVGSPNTPHAMGPQAASISCREISRPLRPLDSSSAESERTSVYDCGLAVSRLKASMIATTEAPSSLLPSPYSRPSSTAGVNGSRDHPATGFTVSMCASRRMTGPSPWLHQRLLPQRCGANPSLASRASRKSATAFSSPLREGMAIICRRRSVIAARLRAGCSTPAAGWTGL